MLMMMIGVHSIVLREHWSLQQRVVVVVHAVHVELLLAAAQSVQAVAEHCMQLDLAHFVQLIDAHFVQLDGVHFAQLGGETLVQQHFAQQLEAENCTQLEKVVHYVTQAFVHCKQQVAGH